MTEPDTVDVADLDAEWTHARTLCVRCEHRWMAVYPITATILECPACHVFAGIPDPAPSGEEQER